jgi:two-component system response regulator YesN
VNILVVDDEVYTVEGIAHSVNWDAAGIEAVYTAYTMKQAQNVFETHRVDILLCDIEMPKGSGLELMEWVREKGYGTVCVFLTSHADFSYANRALRLQSMDYLLKPVAYDGLEKTIAAAVAKAREHKTQGERLKRAEYWDNSQTRITEQFWQRVALGVIQPMEKEITRERERVHLTPLTHPAMLVLLRLCPNSGAEEWEASQLEYAVKNIAAEIFAGYTLSVPMLEPNYYLTVLRADGQLDSRMAIRLCDELIQAVTGVLPLGMSCYLADPVMPADVSSLTSKLLSAARKNILNQNEVYFLGSATDTRAAYDNIPFDTWMAEIFDGDCPKAGREIAGFLDRLALNKAIDYEYMHRFYHDFLQKIYIAADRLGIQGNMLFHDEQSSQLERQALNSLDDIKRWVNHIIKKSGEYARSITKTNTVTVTVTVCKYIEDHLQEELSRNELASIVYLTPDHLSHVFKEKTGVGLSEYIISKRIHAAKELLSRTQSPISVVANMVGYDNTSYFAKLFKREVGKTPKEYRKRHDYP